MDKACGKEERTETETRIMKPTIEQLKAWDTEARVARRDAAMEGKAKPQVQIWHSVLSKWEDRLSHKYDLEEHCYYRLKPQPRVIECEGFIAQSQSTGTYTFNEFSFYRGEQPCKATFVIEEGV